MIGIGIGLLFAFATALASAQSTGNPAGLAPDTPGIEEAKPAPNAANNQDKLFVRQLSVGSRAELKLAKLAAGKTSSGGIKTFAQRMEREHTDSWNRLQKVGKGAKVEVPADIDAEHQHVQTDLSKLSGVDFDRAYLTSQIEDHQKTVNLLLWHISYGQNAELLRYSADTLPVIIDHLEHAQREYQQLTQTPGRE
jgi:putative membrane protein